MNFYFNFEEKPSDQYILSPFQYVSFGFLLFPNIFLFLIVIVTVADADVC